MKAKILAAIREALAHLVVEPPNEIRLEHPADLGHGDYSTNVAIATKTDPEKIAIEIRKQKIAEIEKIEVAGPGFINFYLSNGFFADSVKEILDKKEEFGENNLGAGKKAIVEYSSPNIAKPFSVGHLRSTVIGDALANLLKASGWQVLRDNHLGDWGTQFGKLAVAVSKWGNLEKTKNSGEPVKKLTELYVRFHQESEKDKVLDQEARDWFAKLEKGEGEAKSFWQTCVDLSLIEFNKIYDRLGIKFDTSHGESFYQDKMAVVLDQIKKKNLAKESEGAYLVFFEQDKMPPLMLLKSDGSTLYSLRDLAADNWRKKEYNPNLIINEVGSEQNLYFQQIFETEKLLGWFGVGERVHVAHGLYRFPEGKMSTREGKVIWLEEILDEVVKRAGEFNEDKKVAEAVGIGAIKYNDLKRDSQLDIIFDWDEILNLKGNSGPYLQYTYARTQSILAKARKLEVRGEKLDKTNSIERLLYRFPEVVERAALEYAPHYVCTYLYELASIFNAYYAENKIVSDEANSPYRVALTAAVGQILHNGLKLLGIATPEKM